MTRTPSSPLATGCICIDYSLILPSSFGAGGAVDADAAEGVGRGGLVVALGDTLAGAGEPEANRASSAFNARALPYQLVQTTCSVMTHRLRSASARAPPGPGSMAYPLLCGSSHP